jgi:hypothetical protein
MYCSLTNVQLPHSLRVIREAAMSFLGLEEEIIIPEGVECIESEGLEFVSKVWFPSTLKELAMDFYYEQIVNDGNEHIPFIHVHEKNPIFYSKDGRIYRK